MSSTSVAVQLDQVTASDAAERTCDVAIVGAGPYGLAAAARLQSLDGLNVRVFGEPMTFWAGMPQGMLLRSHWDACHIGFPNGDLTLDSYKAESGKEFGKPVPLDAFIDYGRWFQRTAVPDVDTRRVTSIKSGPGGFRLQLEDGATLRAARVVVAAGIEAFVARPVVFDHFSPDVVTHSSEHRDLGQFSGGRVLVIGGGQSALESAALLHEAGAGVEVIARKEQLTWLHGGTTQARLGRLKPVFYAQTDVGPAGLSRLVAVPGLFRRLPWGAQAKLAHRAIRPAGARWLVDRLAEVPITTGRTVVGAKATTSGVRVTLDDTSQRLVEHVILGTGYRVDVSAYGFLAPELVGGVRQVGGYPVLGKGLESSVPGLHFVGAPAARSFGPVMRFVSGSWYAAAQVTAHLDKGLRAR
jgi:FAD-dependent urate hydroxylase